ncbi:MAG: hypothetical protein IKR41_10540, partial [Bacteroidales bacterium]|nr:hypothetical protein [Bacteroidales bacterium]
MNKHIFYFLLSLTMVLGLMLGLNIMAKADNGYIYRELTAQDLEDKSDINVASVTIGDATTEYTSLTDALAAWVDGSTLTILEDVAHTGDITVSSDATLTIPKGVSLTVMGTITIGGNCTLHITGGGTLTVIGVDGDNNGGKAIYLSGTLIVENATVVNAIGGKKTGDGSGMGGSGIYGTWTNWYNATGSNVIVDGGIVNATGGDGGNWGTDAPALYYCNIIVKSGMLLATGADGSYDGAFSSSTVSSGIVYQSDGSGSWAEVSGNPSAKYVKVTAPEPISYMDWNDTEKKLVEKTGDDACKSYTVVTSSTTTWTDGWYVVKDNVTIDNQIKLNGNVNLILCDGAKLNVNVDISEDASSYAAIHNNEANFTIYAQSTGKDMGELNVKAPNYIALYGKNSNITFNGGKVMMEGKDAIYIDYSILTVNGGDITFTGEDDGIYSYKSQMYVNGGNVTAIGNYSGIYSYKSQMYVDGGNVTVIGNKYGIYSYNSQMYVDGGNVTVIGNDQAIVDDCNVMNSIPGTGWTNKEGTEGLTNIKVSTEGQKLSTFKKVQFPVAHTHNFSYSASGSTITATCSVENCSLTDNKVSLTIVAPEMTVSGTAKNANATLTGLEEFNSATELAVDAADIKYVNRDKGNETSTAPTSAGQYTAKITIEGQTASVDYEILAPVTLTVRSNKEDWGKVEVEGLGNEVIWKNMDKSGKGSYSQDDVMLTSSNDDAHVDNTFYDYGDNTFTSTLGNFTKIEIFCTYSDDIDGWTKEPTDQESYGHKIYKLTWTGDAESITLHNRVYDIQSITFVFGGTGGSGITANEDGTYTVNPGTEVTIKATPAEGFHLASWSNGAEVNEDGTQKIKVTEDIN